MNEKTFAKYQVWLEEVDGIIQEKTGFSVDDMKEHVNPHWFENGMLPEVAANLAIQNAKRFALGLC